MEYAASRGAMSNAGLVLLLSHLLSIAVAWLVCRALPVSLAQMEEASGLGIHSLTILAGYPKSHEFTVYIVWEICVIALTIAVWWGWSVWCGRSMSAEAQSETVRMKPPMWSPEPQRKRLMDWVLISIVIAYAQFGSDRFVTGFWWKDVYWPFLSEEGTILATADRLLHGGVLYRDEFAVYGPLMLYPVSWLMRIVDSVVTLRIYAFILDCLGLLLLYHALLVFFRHRGWAVLGLGFFLLNFSLADFAVGTLFRVSIHESVFRFTVGLAWLLFFLRDPKGPGRRDLVLTGASLGVALTFSHEIGIVSCVSFLILVSTSRLWGIPTREIRRQLVYAALGLGGAVIPWIAFFASHGALRAAITDLFLYPKYIGLGYGALPFPSLDDLWIALTRVFRNPPLDALSTLTGYWIPWIIAVGATSLGIRLLQMRLDRDDRIVWGMVLLAGMLFKAGLGRSDIVHFQPALVPAFVIGLMLARRFAAGVMKKRILVCSWSFWCGIAVSLLSVIALQPPRPVLASFVYGNLSPFDHKLKSRWNEDEWSPLKDIPRARGVLVPKEMAAEFDDVVRYIVSHTRPSDSIVAFPNEAAYYYYAERPNATRFSIAYVAVTHEDRREMIDAMEKNRPPYIIYSLSAFRPDNINENIAIPELVEYIGRSYMPVRHVGHSVILMRKELKPQYE